MSSLRNNYPSQANSLNIPRVRNLTDDGTKTGNPNFNINASAGVVDYWYQPPANTDFTLSQIVIEISDVGNSAFTDYGSIVGPVTNGVKFFIEQSGVERQLGVTVHSNADLLRVIGDLEFLTFTANIRIATYREKMDQYSEGLILRGDSNDKFIARINDDFSSLTRHLCILKGHTQGLKNLNI